MNDDLFEKKFLKKLSQHENIWGKDQRALHLVEEVGELAEIFLQYQGFKKPQKNITDIKVALADVLEDVFALSVLYDIPISELMYELINEDNF